MEIVPNVHMIEGINAHCYLIVDNDITLIDTGLPHKTKKILGYVTGVLHRKPTDVKTILLTHCDPDHIGNALELKRITGAAVVSHPKDAKIIAGNAVRPMPKGGMRLIIRLFAPFMRVQKFNVDKTVNDGDSIAGLKVLHVPGHTPGSISFYDAKRGVLFTGDTLTYRDGVVQGPSERATMDMNQAYQSLKKYRSLEYSVMLSGHGDPLTPNAFEKVTEFLNENESRIT